MQYLQYLHNVHYLHCLHCLHCPGVYGKQYRAGVVEWAGQQYAEQTGYQPTHHNPYTSFQQVNREHYQWVLWVRNLPCEENCFCTCAYVCVAGGADVRRRPQPPHPGEDHPREERAPGGGQPRDTDGISRQCPWVTTWRRVITLVCCRWWRSRLSRSWSRARARPGSTASQTWTGSRTSSPSRQVPV